MLLRALDDTLSADALTPPTSKALELEYLMYLRDMRELRVHDRRDAAGAAARAGCWIRAASSAGLRAPIQRMWLRASNDDERSRRAARMLIANWLAQVNRPPVADVPRSRSSRRS